MSITIRIAGQNYADPLTGDTGWGPSVTNILAALASPTKVLQKDTTTFTLEADIDFGSSFGIKLPYVKSSSANIATAGVLRLSNTDQISWRNFANNGNLTIGFNTSNQLVINGSTLVGTVTSVAATGSTGLAVGGSPITTSGTLTFTLDATLQALATYSSNGLVTQTAADTFTGRAITGTPDRITLTNGNGVAGNPTVDIASTYVGQNTITTLGTVTTGVWNGTGIDLATYVTGNLAVSHLNSGTGASSTTAWFGDGTWKTVAGGITGLANPTSPGVNLTGSNGVATTAMRSDAVLVLDQAITPTWTNTHTYTGSINANGGLNVGSTTFTPLAVDEGGTSITAVYQNAGTSNNTGTQLALRGNASGSGGRMIVARNGVNSLSVNTAVPSGGSLGRFEFAGNDGVGYYVGAYIQASADETFGAGAHGSSLAFVVTAPTTTTLSTVLTIASTSSVFTTAVTGARFIPSGSTIPTNGLYLPSSNTVGLSANSTQVLSSTSTILTVPIIGRFTQSATVTTSTYAVSMDSGTPGIHWNENDQGVDLKRWDFVAISGSLRLRVLSDDGTTTNNVISVNRSTSAVSDIQLGNATNNNTFSFLGTGAVSIGGSVVTTGSETAARFVVTGSTVPANGMYLSAANTVSFAANTTLVMSLTSTLATFTTAVKSLSTTVGALPAAATAGSGARAFVTDANATTFLSVVAGGGANKVPVVSDGTNWLIG